MTPGPYAKSCNMTMRSTTRSERMLFISFLLCACVLLLIPHGITNKLQFLHAHLFQIPLRTGHVISLVAQTPAPATDANSSDLDQSLRENLQLKNHLHNVLAELDQAVKEKESLAQVRLLSGWERHGYVLAQVVLPVVGADQIIINRGKRDGLALGQFMLADNAIVGSICELGTYRAKGTLVTDKSSRIPVYIKTARATPKGILQGLGNGKATLPQIRYRHKIAVGDPVYVEAQSGLLEFRVKVGQVAQCQRDETDPLVWDITVEPASDLKSLNQLHIVVARAQ